MGKIQAQRCIQLKTNTNKPGIIKLELNTVEDKIAVLRAKENLKKNGYDRVYIRSSPTHEQRVARINMQTLLQAIPNGRDFCLTGNGKVIHVDDLPYQRQHTQGDGYHGDVRERRRDEQDQRQDQHRQHSEERHQQRDYDEHRGADGVRGGGRRGRFGRGGQPNR